MKKLVNHTVEQYIEVLSKKIPAPGGGSAAALTGALGVSLLIMAARYSLGRAKLKSIDRKIESIIKKAEQIKKRFVLLIDLDAQAYAAVVESRRKTAREQKKARNQAQRVVKEIGLLCYRSIELAPFIVKNGNPYLISDVEVSCNLLMASFNSAQRLFNENLS